MFSGMEEIEREREIASDGVDKYRNIRNLWTIHASTNDLFCSDFFG